jgi:hypothetical protein
VTIDLDDGTTETKPGAGRVRSANVIRDRA